MILESLSRLLSLSACLCLIMTLYDFTDFNLCPWVGAVVVKVKRRDIVITINDSHEHDKDSANCQSRQNTRTDHLLSIVYG